MILWINLVTDGAPAVALGVDAPDEDVMKRPPRDPRRGVLHGMAVFILVSSVVMTVIGLIIYYYQLAVLGASLDKARTCVFMFMALYELLIVWNSRSEIKNAFRFGLKGNVALLVSVILSLIVTLSLAYIPEVAQAFHLVPPGLNDWLIILIGASAGLFIWPEFFMNKKLWKIE